jgi:hypothetical protein
MDDAGWKDADREADFIDRDTAFKAGSQPEEQGGKDFQVLKK